MSPRDGDVAGTPGANERGEAGSDPGTGVESGADALRSAREDGSGRGAEDREADEPYPEEGEAEGRCEVARQRRSRVGNCPAVGAEADDDVEIEDGEAEKEGAEISMRHRRSRRAATVLMGSEPGAAGDTGE
ncbi:unnamed protein product, partial [Tilletia controversa]